MSDQVGGKYGDIRASIDVDALNTFLATNARDVETPVTVKQFQHGQSNPTYFLTDAAGKRYVLRKKPGGALLSSTAHAVEREFRVLSALHEFNRNPNTESSHRIPIPRPYVLCEDISVIGTPFYVMEFLDGRIFVDARMPEIPPEERKACWLAAVRTLGLLSRLDPDSIGLASFGPHTPYFPRQLKSLSRVSAAQAVAVDIESHQPVGDIPHFKEAMQWFGTHLPDETRTGTRIVHGDYKIDNLVFHKTEPRVIGILDWELCTLGSPLADLGNMTLPFHFGPAKFPPESPLYSGFLGAPPSTVPVTFEEVKKEYCKVTGHPYPIEEMNFVSSWMVYRLAIISQGVAARYAMRQASSADAKAQGGIFPSLGHRAKEIYEGVDGEAGLGVKKSKL